MTPQEAAQKIGGLAEALLDPVDSGIELAALIEMVDLLDTANRNIRSAAAQAKTLANRMIEAAGEQRVVLPNGILAERTGITKLLSKVAESGLVLQDVATRQSSLEDIFVDLLKEDAA